MGHRDRPAPTHPHADGQRHERPALTATPAAPSTTPPTLPSATATRTATVAPAARATTKWTTTPIAPTATACTLAFGDMPPGQPFYVFVCCLACRGIISGYSCGGPGEPCPGVYFHPGAEVTRGQMSKFIANAAGYTDGIPSTQQTFTDVPPDQPFWLFVERAARHGVISGYACGGPGEPCDPQFRPYFRPAASLTRGQAAKFVANAAGFHPDPRTTADRPQQTPPGSLAGFVVGVRREILGGTAGARSTPRRSVNAQTATNPSSARSRSGRRRPAAWG